MQKLQNQLSTGREINKPSDDPFKTARSMELTTNISANDRYASNIDEGIGWLETTDETLGQIGDALTTIYEKTVEGGNGAYGEDERNALKDNIDQLRQQIIQIGNSVYDGRYIFGGDKTTDSPFNLDGTYNGSNNGLIREFSPGVTMDIGTQGGAFADAIGVIDNIISDLSINKSPVNNITDIKNSIDKILTLRSEAGSKTKRLEDMKSKNETETFNMTELLSKTADIDVAEKYMEYTVAENVYTAALQTGSKILQPSLLDFLR
jgi:flagellar hook-associated protein 3 FlgL